MIKDTFYAYGKLTNILNITILILGAVFYFITLIWGYPLMQDNTITNIGRIAGLGLTVVLLIKGIWRMLNVSPMLVTYSPTSEFFIKSFFFVVQWALATVLITIFLMFVLNLNTDYVKTGEKLDFTIFGVVIFGFSLLKFLAFSLDYYLHLDLNALYIHAQRLCDIILTWVIPISFFICALFMIRASRISNRTSDINIKRSRNYHLHKQLSKLSRAEKGRLLGAIPRKPFIGLQNKASAGRAPHLKSKALKPRTREN